MILVSVGTHNQPFNRLVQAMDELTPQLGERVCIQRGSSTYIPKHSESFDFVEGNRWLELFNEASMIVCHGGATTLMNVVRLGKRAVVVPRLKHLREHIYDREGELAESLAEKNLVTVVYDVSELEAAILKPYSPPKRYQSTQQELINRLREYVESFARARE